jgi:hypothetical protein
MRPTGGTACGTFIVTSMKQGSATRANDEPPKGCLLVVGALIGGIVLTIVQPWLGGPAIAVALVATVIYMRVLSRRDEEAEALRDARLRGIALPDGDAWRRLFEKEGIGHLVESVAPMVRPAIRLETRVDATQIVGGSRIGGSPDLPEDVEWPTWDGDALPFVAQLALADVHAVDPSSLLPADGYLWFFHDPRSGDAGGRVIHRSGGDTLVRREHPDGEQALLACSVAFVGYDDIPDLEHVPAFAAIGEADSDIYYEIRDYLSGGFSGARHKLLGWSNPVQGSVELELEPDLGVGARLLLQIDSDDAAKIMWGDLGTLYFMISSEALAAGRFDAVRSIEQCH